MIMEAEKPYALLLHRRRTRGSTHKWSESKGLRAFQMLCDTISGEMYTHVYSSQIEGCQQTTVRTPGKVHTDEPVFCLFFFGGGGFLTEM